MRTPWHRLGPLAACLLMLGVAGARAAEDKSATASIDREALDRHVFFLLRDVINYGADLYNNPRDQSEEGVFAARGACYRLYQRTLLHLRPVLSYRPDLQKAIDRGIADAETKESIGERAFVLRKVIDQVRAEVAPLWFRLGGEKGVSRLVEDFITVALGDKKVDFTRGGKYKLKDDQIAEMKQHFVEWISQETGGPLRYSGKGMRGVHRGMGITDSQFSALVADLRAVLEQNNVRPDAAAALVKIFEKARRDVVQPKEEKKTGGAKVQGKVTLDGQPLPGGKVTFVPAKGSDVKSRDADIDKDGSYRIPDLPPGQYKIAIEGTAKTPAPKQFARADTSGLTLEVKEGSNRHDIALKSK
ncbi:MAG TPA: carboxypeptidase regulatory-like domain-containing protein [Gemmataceae bacterium]|nr:carboxypeptidase regulatory-like domain-containing protein [Gemmataceae bacterium]